MRDNKEKHKQTQNKNKAQNQQTYEISETGYGLESVTKGKDFMAGDQNGSPNGDRL